MPDLPAFLVGPEPGVDVAIPDGVPLAAALARTTVLAVGAHPDDVELLGLVAIGACRDDPGQWFTGVTVTDGAGAPLGDEERERGSATGRSPLGATMAARRRAEQREAARVGRYGLQVQLGLTSTEVRDPEGRSTSVGHLAELLDATRPARVVTHSLVDRHTTHVAVALAVVAACRRLPPAHRPAQLLGGEVWRGHDWLPEHDKVRLDASALGPLGERLLAAHVSQVSVKPYDLAAGARRCANATFDDHGRPNGVDALSLALDLTPLVLDDGLAPEVFVAAVLRRFGDEVTGLLRSLDPGSPG